jgi:excisionase family DNA binding protein
MMTVKEVADALGTSPSLVYGLCKQGRIRHERHGLKRGTIRISPDALEEYRQSAAVSSPGGDGVAGLRHITLR